MILALSVLAACGAWAVLMLLAIWVPILAVWVDAKLRKV